MAEDSERERNNIIQFQQTQQQLQMLLMQKQNIQIQTAELDNAIAEVEKTEEKDIYEIIGNVMVKRSKKELLGSIKEKKEMLDLRASTIDKQTQKLSEKATDLQKELSKQIKK